MSGAGKEKQQVNASLPEDLTAYIAARASKVGWKPTKYAGEIILWWARQGSGFPPPISDNDAYQQSKNRLKYVGSTVPNRTSGDREGGPLGIGSNADDPQIRPQSGHVK